MSRYFLSAAMAAAMVAISPASAQTPAPVPAAPPVKNGVGKPGWHSHDHQATHTRAEVAAHVRTLFDRLDRNRDGYLTKAETADARTTRGERVEKRIERRAQAGDSPADRRAMFDRIDANHDSYISRDEFARAPMREERRVVIRNGQGEDDHVRELGGARPMRGAFGVLRGQMFERADANRDGRVSLQEATAEAYRHFDTADVNRDGRITPEERIQMHQRMRAERRPG
jgi:Ca2+-binding EF-hand superfamily protein